MFQLWSASMGYRSDSNMLIAMARQVGLVLFIKKYEVQKNKPAESKGKRSESASL